MNKFFFPIVSGALALSLTFVSCVSNREEMDSIKNELAALKDKVAANEADVNAQLGTLQYLLQSYKDEVGPKLVALDAQLKKDYASLSDADEALSKALKSAQSALMAAISKNADDIVANKKDIQAAIAEYKKLVADAVAGFEAALKQAREDQSGVDAAQDLAIEALSAQFETCKEAIDEAINNLGESVEELAAAVEEMGGNIEDLKEKVDANFAASLAYTDALEASVKAAMDALEERIAANEAAIKKLNEETIPGIEKVMEELKASIEGLEGNLPALESKKLDKSVFAAFLKEHSEWKGSTDTSIQGINESIEELKAYDAILAGQVEYLTGLVNMLNGDETVEGSIKQQIKDKLTLVYKLIMEDLNALKTDLEGKMETLENDVKGIQNVLALTWEEIAIINGNLEIVKNNITTINSQIATAQGDMKKLREAKTELENRMAALQASIESRSKAIEELVAGLKDKVDIINGDKETEGSIAYAVEQLRASVQAQLAQLPEKVSKNAQEIAKLKEEIGKLQQSIQSLVFVPQYQDLKFGLPFVKIDGVYKAYNSGAGFVVVYKVAPANLAKDLARAVNDALAKGIDPPFAFDVDSDLQTRAADTDPKLIIKDAMGDEGTGKITFFLSHRNFEPEGGNLDKYTVSLRADNEDYNVHVASHYVQATLQTIIELTILTDYVYKPDPATGMVEEDSKIATTGEHNYDIPYTDRKVHAFLQGYEMAAQDEKGVIRTFSQWKALNYDMPEVTEEAGRFYGDAKEYINDSFKGSSSTFAMKNLNMIDVKKKVGLFNKYNITFTCGSHVAKVTLRVTIGKYIGAFHLKLRYKMAWDYDQDAEVDYYNKDKTPDKWKSYTRKGDKYAPYSHFVVKAYLVVDGEERELSGANRVYGLHPYDFTWGRFDPQPAGCNFDVIGTYDERTLSLTKFITAPGERLGETEYVYTGSYNCFDKYSTEPDVTTIVITTVDRKTEDILLPAPEKEVKLLNTTEYKSGDYYSITSDNFADRLMQAYVDQGIFGEGFDREKAFTGEFASMKEIEHAGLSANFEMVKSAGGGESGDENLQIRSKGEKLKSAVLHEVATGSDCQGQENPWDMTYETYVGQRVKFTWPLSVAPLHDYRFVTNGQDTFQVPVGWVGGPDAITKAQTELDLLNFSNFIQVKYEEEGSEHTLTTAQYKDSQIRLVPKLSLVNATEGVSVDTTVVSGLPRISNVTYYSQAPSVEVKSALYVKSGDTEFYVPGSDKMYVGETPVTSVSVMQSNPIAATQANPVNPTGMVSGVGLVELTMKDVLGHSIYLNGEAQNSQYPFAASIASVFRFVRFSVYSVNGSTSIRGWSMEGGDAFGISDTPKYVRLITSGVSAGTYTVVIKARTAWKDYYYTVKVNVN